VEVEVGGPVEAERTGDRSFTVPSSALRNRAQAGRPAAGGKYFYTVGIEQNGVTGQSVGGITVVR
jgi:hypothetical protein